MLEIMNDGIPTLEANGNDAQRITHHELRKKDREGLFWNHESVDSNIFLKIIEEETNKGVWDKLKKLYGDDEK